MRWRYIYSGIIIQPNNTYLLGILLNYIWRRRGVRGCRFQTDGGRKRDYNLQACRRREKGRRVGSWRGKLSRTMRRLLEVEGIM